MVAWSKTVASAEAVLAFLASTAAGEAAAAAPAPDPAPDPDADAYALRCSIARPINGHFCAIAGKLAFFKAFTFCTDPVADFMKGQTLAD